MSSPIDDRVNFTLSLAVQQPEKTDRLIDKATLGLTRQKPVVVLTLAAATPDGTQQVFATAVKVQQVQQAVSGGATPQVPKKVLNHEYVPLSLKVAVPDQITAQEVVYVKVSELAEKTGLMQDLRRIQGLPDNEDQIVDASRVSAFVEQRLIQQQEMMFRADSLQRKLSAPISPTTVSAAESFLAQHPKLDSQTLKALTNNEQFIALRTVGSNSISSSQATNRKPLESWIEASRIITDMALANKPLTTKTLSELHKIVYTAPSNEPDKIPGRYRNSEVMVGGMLGASYLHPRFIEKEMESLLSGISDSIPRCQSGQLNPIIVGARAYQTMLSFHPFDDGNGRICRLVLDYLLQSCNLPPACPGNSLAVAIFGVQEKPTSHLNKSPDEAVLGVIHALNKSYESLPRGALGQ